MPRLPIGKKRWGELADDGHIQLAQGAASRISDVARVWVDGLNAGVPKTPEIEEAPLTPENVFAPGRILWVERPRQI